MKTRTAPITLLLMLAAILSTFRCTFDNEYGDSETAEKRKGLVNGYLFNMDGSPLAFAPVVIHASKGKNETRGLLVNTDEDGYFYVPEASNLAAGDYYVYSKLENTSLYKKVSINESAVQETCQDTLAPMSSLSGKIILRPEHRSVSANMFLEGTHWYFTSEPETGDFTLDSLPAGNFNLHIMVEDMEYLKLDTSINLTAGTHDSLASPIVLEYQSMLATVPQVAYDSLLMHSSLTWHVQDTANVIGYQIYRLWDGDIVRLNEDLWEDTVFVDTLCDLSGETVSYRVNPVNDLMVFPNPEWLRVKI